MTKHIPVLVEEVIKGLDVGKGDTVVDATVGGGGHARRLAEAVGEGGVFVGLDVDKNALAETEKILTGVHCRVCLQNENFRNIDKALAACGVKNFHAILFDLGVSSLQLAYSGRGFSFQKDEPLLMTLASHPSEGALTAYEIVNSFKREDIADILREYGEERRAEDISRRIIEARRDKPIETSEELVQIIGGGGGKRHPATKTFQALRIAVNDELNALREGLEKGFALLASGGRIAVISFHSLEDRIVKHFFKSLVASGGGTLVTKKPITPPHAELFRNRRARSAKLRIAHKL